MAVFEERAATVEVDILVSPECAVPKRVFQGAGSSMESPKRGCDLGACVVEC